MTPPSHDGRNPARVRDSRHYRDGRGRAADAAVAAPAASGSVRERPGAPSSCRTPRTPLTRVSSSRSFRTPAGPMGRMTRKPSLITAVLLLALASAVATTAVAGVLHGEVSFNGGKPRVKRLDETVVWIAELPEPVERKLVKGGFRFPWQERPKPHVPTLVEAGHHYEPRVSVVVVGTPIEVKNEDQVWHGTFSVTPGAAFDLGKRAPGSVDTLRFAKAGLVAMQCDIDPEM